MLISIAFFRIFLVEQITILPGRRKILPESLEIRIIGLKFHKFSFLTFVNYMKNSSCRKPPLSCQEWNTVRTHVSYNLLPVVCFRKISVLERYISWGYSCCVLFTFSSSPGKFAYVLRYKKCCNWKQSYMMKKRILLWIKIKIIDTWENFVLTTAFQEYSVCERQFTISIKKYKQHVSSSCIGLIGK